MDINIAISIDGLDDLEDSMSAISTEALLEAARTGMQSGLQMIQTDARINCPADTGALRSSIYSSTRVRDGILEGRVAAGKEYGVFVEMGTGPKGEQDHAGIAPQAAASITYSPKGWVYAKQGSFYETRGMPARPYLYPAFKANEGKLKDCIQAAVRRALGR